MRVINTTTINDPYQADFKRRDLEKINGMNAVWHSPPPTEEWRLQGILSVGIWKKSESESTV